VVVLRLNIDHGWVFAGFVWIDSLSVEFPQADLLFAVTACSLPLTRLCAGNPSGLLTEHEVGRSIALYGRRRRIAVLGCIYVSVDSCIRLGVAVMSKGTEPA